MVGWLDSSAFARLGVCASQHIRWKRVPYLGALTAIAVFVSWRLFRNQDDNTDGEGKNNVASTNDVEAHDGALLPDENSELCAFHFPEESCVPNGVIPGNQTERVPPQDIQHGERNELNGLFKKTSCKDVTANILPSFSNHLKRENHPVKACPSSSVEARVEVQTLESPVVYCEASNPNLGEGLASHDAGGNLKSVTQAVQDVKNLREAPNLVSTTVRDTDDKNVDTITGFDRVDANNGMLDDFSILSIKNCESNRSPPLDDSHSDGEHKVPKKMSQSLPDTHDAGKNLAGEINVDRSNYHLYHESDREHFVQSSGPVKSVSRDANGTAGEASNSARHKDYAERLRSYDEYLADAELSPTMRSQVLRARASVAMYFDDWDDDDR